MRAYKFLYLSAALCLAFCSKPQGELPAAEADNLPAPYDTAAVDSFAPGATSRNVVLVRYDTVPVDSLKNIKPKTKDSAKKKAEKPQDKNLKDRTKTNESEPKAAE
ncbi:hypothetical protein SAMN05443429_101446 [Cruoricaptor ignavus]|uniref:Uncharacterized protein n=1 Tax=Cruoricaptor ignavus TaxID=1118202 RepID=A0A1M6AWY2_9FLAO|nr:hypothetical protein [Cruoricaptor ignavus]SHI40957.1 hypothetical protein SAMN05443429_101446 [Cruoricaptor ignavus]